MLAFSISDDLPAEDLLSGERARYFEIHARFMFGWQEGSMAAGEHGSDGHTGHTLDSRKDLGLTRGNEQYRFRVTAFLGETDRVGIESELFWFDATTTLQSSFLFDDDAFTRGSRVKTGILIRQFAFEYEHRFLDGIPEVWAGIGLMHSVASFGIYTHPHGTGDLEETFAWVPFLNLETRFPIGGPLALVSRARLAAFGLPWVGRSRQKVFMGVEAADARFADVEVALRVSPLREVSVEAGVEFLSLMQHYMGPEKDGVSYGNNRLRMNAVFLFVGITVGF